jgi:MFS family permease
MPPASPPGPALLRHPSFALLWSSRVLANVGFQMLGVAVGWQLYALTGSALDLGLVGLAQFAPMVVLTLVVGQVADRCDRRLVIVACQIVKTGATAALALGTAGGWLGKLGILGLIVVIGAARAFENPTTSAMVPEVVPRPLLARGMAWLVSANQTAQIVGPALGGLLFALGAEAAFWASAGLFAASGALTAAIRRQPAPRAREPLTLAAVFSGVAFLLGRRVLLGVMSLDLFAVLLGGATALLPVFARDVLGTGPVGLGLLRSAPAVGALVTSVVLARHPIEHGVGRALFRAVIVFGAATVVFGVSTSFPLSLLALAVLGAADVVSVVIRFSLVQLRTPDEMRGRVSAVHSLFTGTSNELGAFESGVVAALLGAVPAVLIGGAGTIAVALLWMALFPEIRRLRGFEERSAGGSRLGA